MCLGGNGAPEGKKGTLPTSHDVTLLMDGIWSMPTLLDHTSWTEAREARWSFR